MKKALGDILKGALIGLIMVTAGYIILLAGS